MRAAERNVCMGEIMVCIKEYKLIKQESDLQQLCIKMMQGAALVGACSLIKEVNQTGFCSQQQDNQGNGGEARPGRICLV